MSGREADSVGAPAEEQPDARETKIGRTLRHAQATRSTPSDSWLNGYQEDVAWLLAEAVGLREQRDNALARVKSMHESVKGSCERAEAAFQERDALREQLDAAREALMQALDCKGSFNGTVSRLGGDPAICTKCEAAARAALGVVAAAETAKDQSGGDRSAVARKGVNP